MIVCAVFAMTACGDKDKDTNVAFDYDYDLSDYITIGKYKGLEYKPTPEFTRTVVENGDKINLDYVGKIDGVAFENGSTPEGGTEIVVGQAGYIDGFENGLVGMSIGSTKALNLKFPDDYQSADLAGKDVVFTVTVNKIIAEDPIETDRAALWETYVASCKVKKYPKKELNAVQEQYTQQYQNYADMYGISFAEFLKTYMNTTEKDFNKDAKEYAQGIVKQDMALFQLARTEKIEATDEEIAAAKADMLTQYGLADEAAFKETYGIAIDDPSVAGSIKTTALLKKVLDFIYDNAKAI